MGKMDYVDNRDEQCDLRDCWIAEQEAKLAATEPRDDDVCTCGDYRHQHVNGTGRCTMPNDLTHGFQPCVKFRFSHRAQTK